MGAAVAAPIIFSALTTTGAAIDTHRQRVIANNRATDQANQAADAQRKQEATQKAQAEQLRIDTLQQPKQVTPDNFMAQKSKKLAQLRLGMGSTVTDAGNPPLQPAPAALKNKLGE
jgi:hypothetical protein